MPDNTSPSDIEDQAESSERPDEAESSERPDEAESSECPDEAESSEHVCRRGRKQCQDDLFQATLSKSLHKLKAGMDIREKQYDIYL